ncbi:MAG TPA: zinc-binding dehydrogenase [Gemmatimonadota bacterium]|nr:zinc-binding dehydrogenase [Gemmatimonadota bacterium]
MTVPARSRPAPGGAAVADPPTGRRMRAAVLRRHGGPEALEIGELPVPQPGPGQVRVRVVAAALNHLDLFVRRGIPGVELPMPHVPGADGAGVIEAVGEEVEGFSPGDEVLLQPGLFCGRCEFCRQGEESLCVRYRLLGEHVHGTLAETVVVPAANVYAKPRGLSWTAAAAFPLAYQTAWRLVITAGRLRAGESVLIHGVGGGVACAALQIARYAGAYVYATSSSRAKLDRAIRLGADVAIDYTLEDIPARIRELTGKRGVDLVVDNVGQATWRDSIECARRGGRIATCGATTGNEVVTPIHRVYWKQLSIHGSTMANRREFATVARLVTGGRIAPVIDRTYTLEEVPAAFARLEDAAQFGKIVVLVDPSTADQ